MNKKVLLVYPPTKLLLREDRCQIPARNVVMSPPLPPTDLLMLAAVAEQAGCICKVADYTAYGCERDDFIKDLQTFGPDYLLVSITTPTLDEDLSYAAVAKGVIPGLTIIAKGAHFLKFSGEVLIKYPFLDMVMRGETEMTFLEIVSGVAPSAIAGLAWRGPHGVVINPDRPFIEELDSLPFPARHLVDNNLFIRPDTGSPQAVIKVSRGCPYHCFFCLATPLNGRVVRKRSPRNIIDEISHCVSTYGIRDFIFWSDFFTHDKTWVADLCVMIRDSGLNIRWSANTRADAIDLDTALVMKKAGCTMVSIGIESGSQELLDHIGKKITLKDIRQTFEVLKKAKLPVLAYYLIGLPWDSRETVEATIRLSRELGSDFASFFIATPFPGTRYYDYAVEHKLFEKEGGNVSGDFSDAYFQPTVRGHFLGKDEITVLRRKAVRSFFLDPVFLAKSIKRIRSLKELKNYAAAAFSLIRSDRQGIPSK